MANIKNFGPGKLQGQRSFSTFVYIILATILAALIIGGIFFYFYDRNKPHFVSGSQEARNSQGLQQILNSKDYQSYQIAQDSIANDYIAAKQYINAEAVLNMVITNVPKDKLTSKTYRSFWYLYEQKGDNNNRKKYAMLTAQKLRQEGEPDTAANFEKDANTN